MLLKILKKYFNFIKKSDKVIKINGQNRHEL